MVFYAIYKNPKKKISSDQVRNEVIALEEEKLMRVHLHKWSQFQSPLYLHHLATTSSQVVQTLSLSLDKDTAAAPAIFTAAAPAIFDESQESIDRAATLTAADRAAVKAASIGN
ncbi:hypothetical protein ACSBR2_038165 [Camellia fascicularis]